MRGIALVHISVRPVSHVSSVQGHICRSNCGRCAASGPTL